MPPTMPQYLWLYMSNEKNPGWLGYVEDDILPKIYRDYFINHEIRIPKKTNQVFQWKVVGFFFVALHGCLIVLSVPARSSTPYCHRSVVSSAAWCKVRGHGRRRFAGTPNRRRLRELGTNGSIPSKWYPLKIRIFLINQGGILICSFPKG